MITPLLGFVITFAAISAAPHHWTITSERVVYRILATAQSG
jgi:hypothetical protein